MPPRPCLDCGTPTRGTRCAPCQARSDNKRYTARGTTAQRGLAGAHARTSQRYKTLKLPCAICGEHGTTENPITAGHIVPRTRGGTSHPSNYQPECRRCNSSKQDRR